MVMMMVMRVQRRQGVRAAGVTICAEVRQAVAAAVHVFDLLGGLIADDSASEIGYLCISRIWACIRSDTCNSIMLPLASRLI